MRPRRRPVVITSYSIHYTKLYDFLEACGDQADYVIHHIYHGADRTPEDLQAELIDKHQPDIIGLQETKVHDDAFPVADVEAMGYQVYFHGQKGHYGVALLCRQTPDEVIRGFPWDEDDAQRRLIMARFSCPDGSRFKVLNGYFPQGENRSHDTKFPARNNFV